MEEVQVPDETDAVGADSDEREVGEEAPRTSDMARRDELLRYLERTASIAGPNRDLIFLESAGSPFGLSADLVDLVESDAVDNRQQSLRTRVESLEEAQRPAVLKLLVSMISMFPGLEAQNVLRAALMLVGRGLVRSDAAPNLAYAVLAVAKQVVIDVELLPAVYTLGLDLGTAVGKEVQDLVTEDDRLGQSEHEEQVFRILRVAIERSEEEVLELRPLLSRQPDGFMARLSAANLLDSGKVARVFTDEAVEMFTSQWDNSATGEAQIDDMRALVTAARDAKDIRLAYSLLARALGDQRSDLVAAWLDRHNPAPRTSTQTGFLLDAVRFVDREAWDEVAELLTRGARTDSVRLYPALGQLVSDLEQVGDWDEGNRSLWKSIKHVWGSPAWPEDWEDAFALGWATNPWGSSERRSKHQLLHEVAHLDKPPKPQWFEALLKDYVEAIASPTPLLKETLLALMRDSASDWLAFQPSEQKSLVAAVNTGGLQLPQSAQRAWQAHLSGAADGPAFPWSTEEIHGALPTTDDFDLETIRLWLRQEVSTRQDVKEFSTRLAAAGQRLGTLRASLQLALGRLNSREVVEVLCHVFQLEIALNSKDVATLLDTDYEQEHLGKCVAELVRSAANERQRNKAMRIWRLMKPQEASVRRRLIEAMRVMSRGGKNALRVVLRNIDLAQDPPRGVKGKLVEALQERASDLGLKPEAERALERAGLVKVTRKGVMGFGRRTEATPEEEPESGAK